MWFVKALFTHRLPTVLAKKVTVPSTSSLHFCQRLSQVTLPAELLPYMIPDLFCLKWMAVVKISYFNSFNFFYWRGSGIAHRSNYVGKTGRAIISSIGAVMSLYKSDCNLSSGHCQNWKICRWPYVHWIYATDFLVFSCCYIDMTLG